MSVINSLQNNFTSDFVNPIQNAVVRGEKEENITIE